MGKAALKNGLTMLTEELAAPGRAQTAGRIGARQGKVSELTVFLPFVKGERSGFAACCSCWKGTSGRRTR